MSKLDEIFAKERPTAEKLGQFEDIKQQIKDLMLEVFKSCEHDGSFVSVGAFEKKVNEL